MDLLTRAWQIKEGDPPDQIRQKVESGAGAILGERKDLIPYIGSLYSLPYPEIEQVSSRELEGKTPRSYSSASGQPLQTCSHRHVYRRSPLG